MAGTLAGSKDVWSVVVTAADWVLSLVEWLAGTTVDSLAVDWVDRLDETWVVDLVGTRGATKVDEKGGKSVVLTVSLTAVSSAVWWDVWMVGSMGERSVEKMVAQLVENLEHWPAENLGVR